MWMLGHHMAFCSRLLIFSCSCILHVCFPAVITSLLCVCNLQPQCQRAWPCWVAYGKPPSCATPSPNSSLLASVLLIHTDLQTHTYTHTCKHYCITKHNYVMVWVSTIVVWLGVCFIKSHVNTCITYSATLLMIRVFFITWHSDKAHNILHCKSMQD